MKNKLKLFLHSRGWFIRKSLGLGIGTDLFFDLKYKLKIDIKTLIDVGSHHGETIESFKLYYPKCSIIAFEPITENFNILKRKEKGWKKVKIVKYALSSFIGEQLVSLQRDSQTNSLREIVNKETKNESVKITTLDHYLEQNEITEIDLLKIDVEGFEKEVLKGSKNTLEKYKVKIIFVEASLDMHDQIHSQLITLQNLLNDYNFSLVGIYDQVMFQNPVRLGYFNALFKLSEKE